MAAYFAHVAPEGMLDSVIYLMGYGTLGLLFAVFTAAYFMPIIGTLFKGPESIAIRRNRFVRNSTTASSPEAAH